MMLRSIDFIQSENRPLEWRLEGLTLGQINLVVGRNASGKSKALDLVRELAAMVSGQAQPRAGSGSYVARFSDPETVYELAIQDARVLRETLTIEGEKKLARGENGVGTIYFKKLGQFVEFQTPESELACAARRDSIQHPYLEDLHAWGRSALSYRFNSLELGKNYMIPVPDALVKVGEASLPPILSENAQEPLQVLYAYGVLKYKDEFRSSILRDMASLGYLLTDVGMNATSRAAKDAYYYAMHVKEDGLDDPIDQFIMSDGMFRAFSILIQVTYATMSGKPSLVLIDDIGEGLDYERSCLLIKLLIDKAKTSGIQLVMATNDRFVMNNVPLEYWTVLARERAASGTRVKVYNYETHKKVFDEFAYTGLNNFDFFATKFFEEGLDAGE
jgi:energy-coupling factor transporter ATP-binding protein EcfA2